MPPQTSPDEQSTVNFLIVAAFTYWYVFLAVTSLKYHAAKARVSWEAVDIFIGKFVTPINIFIFFQVKDIYDQPDRVLRRVEAKMRFDRLFIVIMPFGLFSAGALVGLIISVIDSRQFTNAFFNNLTVTLVMDLVAVICWRFGHSLEKIQATLRPLANEVNPEITHEL
jgi:hypothetical protein